MEFSLDVTLHRLQQKSKTSEEKPPKNIVISPFGINVILHMIANGHKGATLEQILQYLKIQSVDDLATQADKLMQIAKSSKRKENPVICNFNAVLVKEPFKLAGSHQVYVENVFNAKVKSLDFEREDAVAEVNAWAKEETKGCIDQLLNFEHFKASTRVVHANGLYFSGMWENEFLESKTKIEKFHLLEGGDKTVDVPFMKEHGCYYHYASFDEYDVLSIPYRVTDYKSSRRFSMFFMLPRERKGLPNLLNKFRENPHLLSRKHLKLPYIMIKELWIPRFLVSYAFIPSEVMEELGLTLLFSPGNNDLNDRLEDDGVQLYTSRIMQHTKIECNEKGTKVISCTVASDDDYGFPLSPPPKPTIDFIADHPFMFMIKENVSDTIFFLGAIYNPLGEGDEPVTFEETPFRGFEDEESDDDDDDTSYHQFVDDEDSDDLGYALFD